MSWDFTLLAIPLFISALVSAAVALYTWRRRETAGGLSLVVLASGAAIWALADGLTMMSPNLDQYMFWWNVSYIGIVAVPPAWLAFALEYSGNSRWTTKPRLAALAVIPAVSLALVWTEPLHGLMWTVDGIAERDPFILVNIERGPWFWIYTIQAYMLVVLGAVLLSLLLGRSYRRNRYRALALMLLTVALPAGVNIIQALARTYDYTGIKVIDLTPYTFAISIPAITLAIFHYRVQDLAPVARDSVIEQIRDGIVLLDAQFVVLDVNASGIQLLAQTSGDDVVGRRLGAIAPRLVNLLESEDYRPGHYELKSEVATDPERWFDIRFSQLADDDGGRTGYAIVLRDITNRKQLERQLEYQAHYDALTGLANRTLLEDEIERHLADDGASGIVALAFIDLDGFKEINDRRGHQTGDRTLTIIAARLREAATATDVVARWGGDEFAVLTRLPSSGAADVWGTRLLEACVHRDGEYILSASIGIALANSSCPAEQLIRLADSAMYRAKRAGKHRYSVADMNASEFADRDQVAANTISD